jgi:uncharacterized protein (DUF1501 family)
MKRRKFIQYATASFATPFLFHGQWISAMANQSALDLLSNFNPDRKLVLIQLDGGNDGLNMLIPISEYDNLANARRNILIDENKILKLNDETGLHPSMPELTNLYHDGKVQFIQGVGYPSPNQSHFRSMDILTSASDSKVIETSGWAGRMFNELYPSYPNGYPKESQPHPIALTFGSTSSAVCQGDMANFSSVLTNLSANYTNYSSSDGTYPATPYGNELRYINSLMEQTEAYLSVIKAAADKSKNLSLLYPTSGQNGLADKLKLVARLIAGGLQTQLYIVTTGGYDLHSSAVTSETDKLTGSHPNLLSKLSKAIAAFEDDLKLLGKADDAIGFVYTEFGRRIKSNDSLGTDHGTTWPAIVFGSKVNPGIIGTNPKIPAVVSKSDNLSLQNDFRSIYSGLYKQWFGFDDQQVVQLLGRSFPEIQVIAKSTKANTIYASGESLKMWPNPVENNAKISFVSDGELVQIQIYSMNGQLVENHMRQRFPEGIQHIDLQLGHLAKGTYQLVLVNESGRQTVKFIIK